MITRGFIAWGVLAALGWPAAVQARPLSMRRAERAIDLGFQAELAGDGRGARAALEKLVATSTLAEDEAGRQRVRAWLAGLSIRQAAFSKHGRSARAYSDAYETLRGFGITRADTMWKKALVDVPGLAERDAQAAVEVRVDLARGVKDPAIVAKHLEARLVRLGVKVAPEKSAQYHLRVNVDASDVKQGKRRAQVTAEGSFVLRDPDAKQGAAGAMARTRREERRRVEVARNVAVRRLVDDLGEGAAFQVRAHLLRASAAP